ncbi:uncharacterized protein K444DRAFT_616283 [Hyaloscypha bicolor E]|uniref:Secreted protein n=1 Tax=Hyaloscypha bicolor E TaxID=1095630 RepID=A0A2J6T081_9HELO|nr:uncharacterized protein K444DRAFT_616283 [Hyaloscypha bicolor E]PMD56451.1 hypothetical protein K444DRAFT_616283 [Hyaloscypha bicolor E]
MPKIRRNRSFFLNFLSLCSTWLPCVITADEQCSSWSWYYQVEMDGILFRLHSPRWDENNRSKSSHPDKTR